MDEPALRAARRFGGLACKHRHDWDNWRDRIFRPPAHPAGLPEDIRPRDLRSSFATLLIHEGRTIVEVARQLGHSASTCLKDYAGVFEEFDPAQRVTADEVIAAARSAKTSPR